jgi:hypothetical protein
VTSGCELDCLEIAYSLIMVICDYGDASLYSVEGLTSPVHDCNCKLPSDDSYPLEMDFMNFITNLEIA